MCQTLYFWSGVLKAGRKTVISAGHVGLIMIRKYMVTKWEREKRMVRALWKDVEINGEGEEWADVGACLPPGAMVMSGLGCSQGPCLGLWSYSSQCLC